MLLLFTFCFLTISGVIEIIPFLLSKPSQLYAYYGSDIISFLRNQTPNNSVFIASNKIREIQLAGRKLFLGNYPGQDFKLRSDVRIKIIKKIFKSRDLNSLCQLATTNKIDYIEANNSDKIFSLKGIYKIQGGNKNNQIILIDVKKSCQ